jgi:hypothetical protein
MSAETIRCAQCWLFKPAAAFLGPSGRTVKRCDVCRERYSGWETMTLEQELAGQAPRVDPAPTGRVLWMSRSGNKKLGGIPASMSERGTCPPSCGLYQAGCYAGYGKLGAHWRQVGERGLRWEGFLAKVRALPEGQLWRHNISGDLQPLRHEPLCIDPGSLRELVGANHGRRGFSFSHFPCSLGSPHWNHNASQIRMANTSGFTINVSVDTVQQADSIIEQSAYLSVEGRPLPVAVLLPHDAPIIRLKTPRGRHITVCPAETSGLTCADCELCAKADRAVVIGFRAHGQAKRLTPELVQLRKKPPAEARS